MKKKSEKNKEVQALRQEQSEQIDFPSLGDALSSLNLGTVDLKRLSQKHGDTEFLTGLITREIKSGEEPDAVIIAGPKVTVDDAEPGDALRQMTDLKYPVFYMNYNLNPQQVPWRDSIGNAVKFFKGYEYTISRPRDLWFAVTDVVSRIVKLKHGRSMSASSAQ